MTGGYQVRNQVSGTVSFTVRPHMPTLRSLLLCGRIRGRHLVGTGVEAPNFLSTWLTGAHSEISGAAWVRSLSSHGSLMRLQTIGRSSQNFLPGARRERTIRVKYMRASLGHSTHAWLLNLARFLESFHALPSLLCSIVLMILRVLC